jgi:3-oxoacyl-(acyl-carrier-protein) synthase
MTRRAVITGVGIVAPNGIGNEIYWQATLAGRSSLMRISRFDPSKYATQIAGEITDFQANDFIEQRLVVQTDRWTWFALAATQLALQDAAFDPATKDPFAMSVITASSSGGNEFGQREIQNLWGKGAKFVGAYQSIAWFYAASTGQISIRYGMKGPSSVLVSEGAGALDALGHSRRMIRRGGVDLVVSGGTEAPVGPYALTCQIANRRLSEATDPAAAYRPFDVAANGYVPGEGGAILLVEELESAQQRGAPQIYAEVAGYASTNDAYHPMRAAPDSRQLTRALTLALADAGVEPEGVDVVFADAAGTPEGDIQEAAAINEVFGVHVAKVPVTAPKTMVGRLYSGGGALDLATALLALRDGRVPPTINLDQPAPGCELNFVLGAPRELPLNTALVIARGFGGFNSAVVLKRFTA